MDNEQKLVNHTHLIRLDDELNSKLMNHMVENDMNMAGVIRRSLRQFFKNEELKIRESGKKITGTK